MSIVSRKFDRKDTGTVFRHVTSDKILCRLDAQLSREDREQLLSLFSLAYNSGMEQGSQQRAAEIRVALGIETCS